MKKLGESFEKTKETLQDALLAVWEYIKTTLSNAFEGIKNVGKNLIEGLWNGIKNAKDWLIKKIQGFCDDALGAIKAFFGIESPSRVMANEVGNYMAERNRRWLWKNNPICYRSNATKTRWRNRCFSNNIKLWRYSSNTRKSDCFRKQLCY